MATNVAPPPTAPDPPGVQVFPPPRRRGVRVGAGRLARTLRPVPGWARPGRVVRRLGTPNVLGTVAAVDADRMAAVCSSDRTPVLVPLLALAPPVPAEAVAQADAAYQRGCWYGVGRRVTAFTCDGFVVTGRVASVVTREPAAADVRIRTADGVVLVALLDLRPGGVRW
ncbi:hypothetical protein [Actinomadura yumaensis]|uniref:Uncharacterized protein n=1 Tax=Actinomadura yumaensis TaxID=111807 RepID=A0ABW2CSV5_9ACTN